MSDTSADRAGRESLQSLERGVSILRIFSPDIPAVTLSEAARLTGMTRASARRVLLTFQSIGYLRSDGRQFAPTTRLLDLGWAYVSSLQVPSTVRPLMRELVNEIGESSSMAAYDAGEIVYVARVHAPHVMTIPGGLGSRLPAAATALGRVLLANLPGDAQERELSTIRLEPYTHRTVTDTSRFQAALRAVKRRGWALVDEELELGLRAIAVPVTDADDRVAAALSVSSATSRITVDELQDRCLPPLMTTAGAISEAMHQSSGDRLGASDRAAARA